MCGAEREQGKSFGTMSSCIEGTTKVWMLWVSEIRVLRVT